MEIGLKVEGFMKRENVEGTEKYIDYLYETLFKRKIKAKDDEKCKIIHLTPFKVYCGKEAHLK